MNPWIIIAALWLPLSALAALTIGRWIRGPQTPAPAARPPRVPAPSPVPGERSPGVAAAPPPRPAPAPAEHFTHGRRILTVRFYEDGATCIWDATGTHVATFQGDHDWDQWLRRMTPDARD